MVNSPLLIIKCTLLTYFLCFLIMNLLFICLFIKMNLLFWREKETQRVPVLNRGGANEVGMRILQQIPHSMEPEMVL